MQWKIKPWQMRLITRVLSLIPSIAIAATGGKSALGLALTASQVILSILLPVISAPLVYMTCRKKFMTVSADRVVGGKATKYLSDDLTSDKGVDMSNGTFMTVASAALWVVVAVMNVALLVLIGIGKA
jgi:metal iron transporter